MSDLMEERKEICSRCKREQADVYSRKEAFCKSCFIRFISGKQRKQMNNEKYKVKFGDDVKRKKVLFPISFGQSSIVLLDILISMYDEQMLNPRAKFGYEINVLFVDDSSVEKYDRNYSDIIKSIKKRYQMEKYPIKFTILDINSFFGDKKSLNKITLLKDFTSFKYPIQDKDQTIEKLMNSCPSRASKHDLKQVIVRDLINRYAFANDFETILFGSNMSTLGEQVIALTVKGRGSEIYTELSDGFKNFQGKEIEVLNPLRDVSSREIELFFNIRDLSEFQIDYSLKNNNTMMNKQKTINEIVLQYFKTVDTEYDNIVSTVVKTGAKLAEPKNFDGAFCIVCRSKIYNKPMAWLRDITNNESRGPENKMEEELLQEWKDANKEVLETFENAEKSPVDVCYGCAVTIGYNVDQSVLWPLRNSEEDKQKILNDFVLDDDSDEE